MSKNPTAIAKIIIAACLMTMCAACSNTSGSDFTAEHTSGSWSASNSGPGNGYYYENYDM